MAQASHSELNDDEWLEQRYNEDELSVREIAIKTGATWDEVRTRLDEAGVEVHGNETEAQKVAADAEPGDHGLDDPDELERLYDEKTQAEIAEERGVSQSLVSYYLDKHDIDTVLPEGLDEPGEVERLYAEEGWTIADMAVKFEASQSCIKKFIQRNGITPHESHPDVAPKEVKDRDWLASAIHGDGMTDSQVADKLGCHEETVKLWRRRLLV